MCRERKVSYTLVVLGTSGPLVGEKGEATDVEEEGGEDVV